MVYPVIIIGGGFSGLVVANRLTNENINFLLLERNDRLGKKILATGNGRGNVSNDDLSQNYYHGRQTSFVNYSIKKYDNRLIGEFFSEFGIILTTENGKIYPASKQANAILDGLRLKLKQENYLLNCFVTDLKYNEKEKCFTVTTDLGTYKGNKVVLCVGGKSAPHFGTDGASYKLATNLGHGLTDLYPSLVQLVCKREDIKGLKGIKETALVSAVINNKEVKSVNGDILFTDNGVSGNTVFQLSSYVAGQKNVKLKINYIFDLDTEKCIKALALRRSAFYNQPAEALLSGLVHSRISIKTVNEYFKGEHNLTCGDVDDKAIKNLVHLLQNTYVSVEGNTGFANSQVTRGGIITSDICDITMESKLAKGLYFCGEVLDIDGDCGGYNLQWAFSSAMCASDAIIGDNND